MEKSPCYKKSLEIKSYHFVTLFFMTFLSQKRPRKKSPFIVENAWWTKDVYNHAKKGAIDIKKHPRPYSKYRCKSLFLWNRLRLNLIYSQDFFLGFFFFKYIFFVTFPRHLILNMLRIRHYKKLLLCIHISGIHCI